MERYNRERREQINRVPLTPWIECNSNWTNCSLKFLQYLGCDYTFRRSVCTVQLKTVPLWFHLKNAYTESCCQSHARTEFWFANISVSRFTQRYKIKFCISHDSWTWTSPREESHQTTCSMCSKWEYSGKWGWVSRWEDLTEDVCTETLCCNGGVTRLRTMKMWWHHEL